MDDADQELGKDPRRTDNYVSEQIARLTLTCIIEDLIYRLFFTDPLLPATSVIMILWSWFFPVQNSLVSPAVS